MISVFLKCYFTEGRLEVFQGEKLLSSIPMWTTFGELAILYNCTRTASVKGKKREAVGSPLSLRLSPYQAGGILPYILLFIKHNCIKKIHM